MKKKILTYIILLVPLFNLYAQNKTDHKIVFQFTNAIDTLQQKAFMRQLENIFEVWPDAKFQVVIYNYGVDMVLKSNMLVYDKMLALKQKGINFVVCENTMKSRKLTKENLHQELVGFVRSGIMEMVLKQEEGYSYVKGGF